MNGAPFIEPWAIEALNELWQLRKTQYAPTPTGRLAQLALEALDGDDPEMVRVCLRRLIELGDKT